jgi:hypothetical protein
MGSKCEECRRSEAGVQRRAQLEPQFGHDFRRVPVHVDARATDLARSVQAPAYPFNLRSGGQPKPVFGTSLSNPKFIDDVDDGIPSVLDNGDAVTSDNGTADPLVAGGGPAGGGSCSDICSRAYANPALNSGGGGVICDGATKCPCAFDVAPLVKGQCPGFDALVVQHEQHHLSDVDCNPAGGLHRPPFRNPGQANASECAHRTESIAQLDAILPIAAGICKSGMQAIRSQLQTWVTAHCGAPGP